MDGSLRFKCVASFFNAAIVGRREDALQRQGGEMP